MTSVWTCRISRSLTCAVDDLSMDIIQTRLSHDGPTIMPSPTDYDLADGDERNEDFASNPYIKRRRAGESPFSGLTARFGTRFPSFSQGWRRRRAGSTISITESCPSPSLRVNTSRASSVVGSPIEASERQDYQLPPTPARSVFDGNDGKSMPAPIDIQKAKAHDDVEDVEGTATTPLLPPMMAQFASQFKEEPLQSPLQSPTVAEFDSSTPVHSPISAPQQPGIPSPPLSTKPSISSFHRQRCPNPLIPSSEIPPILTADPNDEWANKLGHANFTIYPEPYLPYHFDLNACKHLRAEWDLARCNYVKHLMRTGEHYGATSKIYKFTEEKWSEVDAQWKKNSEHCISRTADNGETSLSLSQSSIAEPAPLMKLPSLNGPHSEGKFPKRGDEDIVGPMEQIASQLQRRPSKKAAFLKFLQGVFAGERSP